MIPDRAVILKFNSRLTFDLMVDSQVEAALFVRTKSNRTVWSIVWTVGALQNPSDQSLGQDYFMPHSSNRIRSHSSVRTRSMVTLVCLMVFSVTFVIYTSYYLPSSVASHFNLNNEPDGWMTRNVYVLLILTLLISIPSVISVGINLLCQKFSHLINLPNGDYWLAPPRLNESLDFLAAHGHRLGRLVIVLMTGLHYVVLVANRAQPPALPQSWFIAILLGFVFALGMWVLALYRRFSKPS